MAMLEVLMMQFNTAAVGAVNIALEKAAESVHSAEEAQRIRALKVRDMKELNERYGSFEQLLAAGKNGAGQGA